MLTPLIRMGEGVCNGLLHTCHRHIACTIACVMRLISCLWTLPALTVEVTLQVCPGCVLRFLKTGPSDLASPLPSAKVAHESLHRSNAVEPPASDDSNQAVPGGGTAVPNGREAVCPVCLGILQSLGAEGFNGVVEGTLAGGGTERSAQAASEQCEGPSDRGNDKAECLGSGSAVRAGQKLEVVAEEKLGPGSNLWTAIKAGVQRSGQQYDNLALEVALPPLVQVRQHALW